MAIANNNFLFKNYSGKVGNIILRVVGNRSIISKYPDFTNVKWSKAQKANRKRFGDGMRYARKAFKDPEAVLYYESKTKPRQNKFNVAVSDYMLSPEIQHIDTTKYLGQEGNTITVSAYDKYKIMAVIVTILNATGFEIESGMAVEFPYNGSGEWIYKTLESNPSWRGGRVVVRVTDSPGKVVKAERRLDDT
jgi:hypothetical protein